MNVSHIQKEGLLKMGYECELCGRVNGHLPRCPLFSYKKAIYYCSTCGEGIYEGEEYITNDDDEHRHFDCFCGMRDLLEWLGYEIKTMEDTYEDNY
jgi:DNA-directed RNA polymerase subunit RPC12/RpoP